MCNLNMELLSDPSSGTERYSENKPKIETPLELNQKLFKVFCKEFDQKCIFASNKDFPTWLQPEGHFAKVSIQNNSLLGPNRGAKFMARNFGPGSQKSRSDLLRRDKSQLTKLTFWNLSKLIRSAKYTLPSRTAL